MAEVAISRRLFGEILRLIDSLQPKIAPVWTEAQQETMPINKGLCLDDRETTKAGRSQADGGHSQSNLPGMAVVPHALVVKLLALAF